MDNLSRKIGAPDVVTHPVDSQDIARDNRGISYTQTANRTGEQFDSGISMTMSIREPREDSASSLSYGEQQSDETQLDFPSMSSGYGSLTFPQEIWAFIPNDEGDHVLHLAVAQENLTAIASAFQAIEKNPVLRPCLNDRNDLGQTPLHIAVHTDQAGMVRDLVKEGALLDIVDRNGNTPVHVACTKGHTRSLDAMLSASESRLMIKEAAERKNINGMACPHLAARRGDAAILRWLYTVGVDMNCQESGSGRTPLHLVTEKKSLTLLHLLVSEFEVEVDVPTYSGYTPLHMAAGGDSMELVAMLVAMGSDPFAVTDEEEKPEDLPRNGDVKQFLSSITGLQTVSNGIL